MDGSALTFVSQGSVREGEREGGKERENPQLTPLLQIERGKKCFFFSACGKRRVAGGDEIARVFTACVAGVLVHSFPFFFLSV